MKAHFIISILNSRGYGHGVTVEGYVLPVGLICVSKLNVNKLTIDFEIPYMYN